MKTSPKSQGYVLAVGLIILFLASLLSFSGWNVARFSFKAAVNYQQKVIAKKAAFIALHEAEEALKTRLKDLKDPDRLYEKTPRFSIEYLGGKNTELFYFRVTALGGSGVETHPILTAFYYFKRGADGSIEGGRRALYVF